MKKRLFAMTLAVLMLCALMGCNDTKPDDKDTPTTTTTQTQQETAPLTLVEGEVDPELLCYHFMDKDALEQNEELILKANVDLTNVQILELNATSPTIGKVLFTQPIHHAGQYWCIHTYVNDAVPNRGVACTDENGKTYYYAIAYSMKGDGSPSLSLTELNVEALSAKKLVEIEAFLSDEENNGFVSMNEYTCPEEVYLYYALYGGAGIGVGSWEWPDEEVQDYLTAIGWEEIYVPVLRFKRGDVEALVQKKLGISLSDLTKDIDLRYVEKYDAYYHAHSDTNYQTVKVLHGWLEGGLYVVDYEIGAMGDMGRVTLKLTKDGYQFISNVAIED